MTSTFCDGGLPLGPLEGLIVGDLLLALEQQEESGGAREGHHHRAGDQRVDERGHKYVVPPTLDDKAPSSKLLLARGFMKLDDPVVSSCCLPLWALAVS